MSIHEMQDIITNFIFLLEDSRLELTSMGEPNSNGLILFEAIDEAIEKLGKANENLTKIIKLLEEQKNEPSI